MKTNLKTIVSLIIIILLSLCILSGCNTNSENDIVGKWYNEKEKCLDIRSDGTYKLEDSYGTGTWKLLGDSRTYEFLDYYGDSQESIIHTDDFGVYIDFGYYGDFYKDSFPSTNVQNTAGKNQNKTDIQVLNCITNEGFYEVEFKKGDKTYCGIADAKGQIFYYTDNYSDRAHWSGVNFTPMSENSGYLCESKDNKTVYTIINSSGSEKTFDEDDFDKILGEGGGYILVYKNTGNISKEEHSYGLINSKGEWEIALTPGTKIPDDEPYIFAGEKVFIQANYYGNSNHYVVFDCAKNTTIGFDDCSIMSKTVYDGKFITKAEGWFSDYCMPYGSQSNKLNGFFMFCTDGSYEKITELKYAFDKIAICEDSEYIQIWDLESNSVSQYDDFSADSIVDISFIDKYGLLTIRGLDGNHYFTVIDANGQQQFEPKICMDPSNVKFFGDRTIYKNQNNYFEMIDNRGNLIISEDKKCSSLQIKCNAVSGKVGNVTLYLDKDGNEITFCLSK